VLADYLAEKRVELIEQSRFVASSFRFVPRCPQPSLPVARPRDFKRMGLREYMKALEKLVLARQIPKAHVVRERCEIQAPLNSSQNEQGFDL
jgi:hypothetical protein